MPLPPPWTRAMWGTTLACLLLIELLAFYLLCAHQVQKAQARRAASQLQWKAFSDCLAYVDGSTIASCRRQMRAR